MLGIYPQIAPCQAVHLTGVREQSERKCSRNKLRNDRRVSHARNPRIQQYDKREVECYVHYTCQYQEKQRARGVAHRAKYAAANVIDKKPGNAAYINSEIQRRLSEHILRRVHDFQHTVNPGDARGGEDSAQGKGGGNRCLYRVVQLVRIVRAEVVADDDARADGKAVEEEHEHIDNRRGRANRRKSLLADEVAYDDGIDRVVKHLKHIAEH